MEVQIPILYDGALTEYEIINLGRFLTENRIRKIPLPEKAVVTAAGDIRPLSDEECINMSNYKVCPKHAIGPFSSCLQSVFKTDLSIECPAVDVISPTTCTSALVNNYMAISMYGNGTMHFDLGRGDLLLKPTSVYSFAVLLRKTTRGTLFCKQSRHKHVTPDLILPSLENEIKTEFEILEIPHTGKNLVDLLPMDQQVHVVKNQLRKASEALDSTEKLLADSHLKTSTTLEHFKLHVNNAVETVETKVSGIYWNIILKVILPIVIPMIILLLIFIIFNEKLKGLCKKTSIQTSNSKNFGPSHILSNRDESDLESSTI